MSFISGRSGKLPEGKSMAGTGRDSQKQLLSLIRNFAAEKSQGERRVVTLRKQIEKLTSELSVANAELEDAKRCKELVEQELKGFEVQLFMSEASAQTLEARISLIQDEISAVRSELETLKNEEAALREQFINIMLDLNAKIRKFHESIITCDIDEVDCTVSTVAPQVIMKESDAEVALSALESMLSEILSQITKEDEEYQAELEIHNNVQQELIDCERKVSLLNMIVTETKALEDLTMQSSKLEATYNSLGEELQRRCVCPSCHLDNLEAVSALLLANEDE